MNASDQRVLEALLRHSLYSFARKAFTTVSPGEPFLPNWHLETLCYHLELVRTGKIRRLKIEVPPRSLKSVRLGRAPSLCPGARSHRQDHHGELFERPCGKARR